MRLQHLTYCLLVFVASLGWISCDTARNMESPLEKYFLKYVGIDGDQEGVDMAVASDGSIFLLGNTTSPRNGQQLYVTRMTPAGIVVWDILIGDANDDVAKDIELLQNGSLAVLGAVIDKTSNKTDFRIRLLNMDSTLIDSVTYGHPAFNEDAMSISETADSFIVSGSTDSLKNANVTNGFFVRFNKDLSNYSGVGWGLDRLGRAGVRTTAVKTIEDGNYLHVFGYDNRLQAGDVVPDFNTIIWVLNAAGGLENELTLGDSTLRGSDDPGADDILGSVSIIPGENSFLLSGSTTNPAVPLDIRQSIFTFRIRRDLVDIEPRFDNAWEIVQGARLDQDSQSPSTTLHTSAFASLGSGFFTIGCKSFNGEGNIYIKKLANNLSDAWVQPTSFVFGGVGSDLPGAVAESPVDGGVLVLGTMVLGEVLGQRKMVLIKLRPDGRLGE